MCVPLRNKVFGPWDSSDCSEAARVTIAASGNQDTLHEGYKWPWGGEGSGGSTSLWNSRTVPLKAVTVQTSMEGCKPG